jgi:hypothetical protein
LDITCEDIYTYRRSTELQRQYLLTTGQHNDQDKQDQATASQHGESASENEKLNEAKGNGTWLVVFIMASKEAATGNLLRIVLLDYPIYIARTVK